MKRQVALLAACATLIMLLSYAAVAQAQPRLLPIIAPATVKVFFPKTSDTNPAHVYSVTRFVKQPATATYAMQLVIAGPTQGEQSAYGVYSEVNEVLTGSSNCVHRDFKITLNHRGSKAETDTATLQFCRDTQSPGVGTDARITSQVNATLKQFIAIKKVVILTKAGHCFGDESGLDNCLK